MSFPVVGVGASAGGLESLEHFFVSVRPDSGKAYVVVQHLSPHFKTMMDHLLARRTMLPVEVVTDGVQLEPNHVYLLPPAKTMVLVANALVLADKDPSEFSLPIDRFFESLAQSRRELACGVVLSGTGSDGTVGLRAIKDLGGITLAESSQTAKFGGMPRSAIDSGCVDAVLPPGDMAAAIDRVFDGKSITQLQASDHLGRLLETIRQRRDLDLTSYRTETLERRIARRATLVDKSFEDYVDAVAEDPEALDLLISDLLINVTRFFRDQPVFDKLEALMRERLDALAPSDSFRIWSAGCATGEEPYSLAILAREAIRDLGRPVDVKIFATDLSRAAVFKAARGVFGEEQLSPMSEERLRMFFEPHPDGYVVTKEIRDMIVFSPHDLLRDAPFTQLDLVVCRNLLIYLQRDAQNKSLSFFHFGLKRDGLLCLGPSESPGSLDHAFEVIDEPSRIYRKIPRVRIAPRIEHRGRGAPVLPLPAASMLGRDVAERLAMYDFLCERFLPPSVVLNHERQVLESFGGAQRYLSIKGRRVSMDFLELFDGDMKGSLAGALRVLERDNVPLMVRSVTVGKGEEAKTLSLRLERLGNFDPPRYLISFEPDKPVTHHVTEFVASQEAQSEIAELEADLARTREHLQSTVEQLEASNEELQATNEELIASNEELQSTNEELSSVNEELYTVNSEYQNTIREVRDANEDIRQLLYSTEIPTLFLDPSLRIRRFTPALGSILDLEEKDVGRRLTTFHHRLEWEGFYAAIQKVLETRVSEEREVGDERGRRLLIRIHAYGAGEVEGVVVTMTDVSALSRAKEAIIDRELRFQALANALPQMVFSVDADERYSFVNAAYLAFWQRSESSILGKNVRELLPPAAYELIRPHMVAALSGQLVTFDMPLSGPSGDRQLAVSYIPQTRSDGTIVGFYGAATDITDRHREQLLLERARAAASQASAAKSAFLANMSHEIRTPLTAIMGYTELLSNEVTDETARRRLETVRHNSRHLLAIINDVLDLSRIEADQDEEEAHPFSLVQLVWEVYDLFRARATAESVEFTIALPDLLPASLISGPRRIRQILMNLISNAIKFTPSGGHVALRARLEHANIESRPDAFWLKLEVEDTGIGFSEDVKDEIFLPFHQLDSSGSRRYEGTGLGLAICKRLAERLGGSIETQSELGKGSLFRVVLPVREEDPTLEPSTRPQVELARAEYPTLRGHILAVDDNDDLRELVRASLVGAGARATTLENGSAAVELVRDLGTAEFDAVVVDVQMPGMDGLEVTRRLRQMGYDRPIVALTARALLSDRDECMAAGCTAYLRKPISVKQLLNTIASVIQISDGGSRADPTSSNGSTRPNDTTDSNHTTDSSSSADDGAADNDSASAPLNADAARRILLVEDDSDNGELMKELLESRGFEVDLRGNYDTAMKALESGLPGAILSDLSFGSGPSGLDLARAVRAKYGQVRMICLSGSSEMREESERAGFDHFVVKPAAFHTLIGLLDE